MAFGSIEITSIARTQDYTTIKHNEDHKAMTDQINIGHNVQKDIDKRAQEVNKSDQADWYQRQFDSREKGDNEYAGNGGKDRKKKQEKKTDATSEHHGFDIKI